MNLRQVWIALAFGAIVCAAAAPIKVVRGQLLTI